MLLRPSNYRVLAAALVVGLCGSACTTTDSVLGGEGGEANGADATGGNSDGPDSAAVGDEGRGTAATAGSVNAPAGTGGRTGSTKPTGGAANDGGVVAGRECTSADGKRPDADGCGICKCDASGQWVCNDDCANSCIDSNGRTYEFGEIFPSADGCSMCVCTEEGTIGCDDSVCECTPGDTQPDADGCNQCFCGDDRLWSCTKMNCTPACTPGDATLDTSGLCCICVSDGTWECTTQELCPVCLYDGVYYGTGRSFPSGDGCNVCTCEKPAEGAKCTTDGCPAVVGKDWMIQVDRELEGTPDVAFPHDPLAESDYVAVLDGPRYPVTFSADGNSVTVSGNPEWGETTWTGTLDATGPNQRSYDLTEGPFAGGRLVIWLDATGTLEAETTVYGSGVPITGSERGKLVEVPEP